MMIDPYIMGIYGDITLIDNSDSPLGLMRIHEH